MPRNTQLAVAMGAMLVGLLGLAIGTISRPASAVDEQMVTEPEQGVVLPARKVADIQDAEGPEDLTPQPAPSPEPPDPEEETPPAAISPTVSSGIDENGDESAPFPDSILSRPTNHYEVGTSQELTTVYAGAMGSDPSAGQLILVKVHYETGGGETSSYAGPPREGPFEITGVSGSLLSLRTSRGSTYTFDLQTRELRLLCPWYAVCGSDP